HSHYVDGELAGSRVEATAMTAGAGGWRIFHDVAWQFTPNGGIYEVRFWNVARTQEQIRDGINREVHSGTGLVSVYPLDGNANDPYGGRNGTKIGAGGYLNGAITGGCTTSATQLCVGPSGRYAVTATYQTDSTSGTAQVAALSTSESGIFWFFAPTNWEVVVKVLNGCPLNSRKWVFISGLTNQHFELVVTDLQAGVTKRYFNYLGVIAPQIQDVDVFATCP